MNSRPETLRVVSEGHGFLEAPRWYQGRLYVSDFFAHQVLSFDGDGVRRVVCEVPGQPSGLGWSPDGDLLVVSMLDRKLLRLSAEGLVEVADLSPHMPWHANDMAVDEVGRCFVGNFGWDESTIPTISPTVLVRVDPDGTTEVAAEDLVFPNGIVITPDQRTLLVAETFAARITAFDLGSDGALTARRTWADFSRGEHFDTVGQALDSGVCLPDGIALNRDGTLWVADAARQGALRVAEGGEVIERISLDDQTAFSVAVGDNPDTLFLCAGLPYGQGDPRSVWQSRLYAVPLADD
ncbi:SMP-30/gluconolactonase/LRE family protein [Rhodococcus jostii]|uniref:SMP-30/gluconolactonase/LRE family protein n=1 Tax=Rhodococcus jostii TaxID=132919 RepID=A0ABU4CTG9_RHOJO|nr:SMP-30/gluconolactonase/LRE family protein [Rhodococcus jostii]MDV6286577.1 SMP-30/gluconolactonase/LRE family protein [Rhodococcus jostii]